KIELLNLSGCMDPKASNYKSYYVHEDNQQCRFAAGRQEGPNTYFPPRTVAGYAAPALAMSAALGRGSILQHRPIKCLALACGRTPSARSRNLASSIASVMGFLTLPTAFSTNFSRRRPSFKITVARACSSFTEDSTMAVTRSRNAMVVGSR